MSAKNVGALLWVMVLVFGGIYIYKNADRGNAGSGTPVDPGEGFAEIRQDHDGREFADIPWKRLPVMQPFVLTERSGEKFNSRTLAGKPYVLSFFFTTCPTICRDLNRQIGRLANRFKGSELTFIGLSVNPKTDTPEVLREYAEQFNADPARWLMMTELAGQRNRINEIGKLQLRTIIDGEHHTPDIFLIDRWGRYRDRFTWDDPREMKRFAEVAGEVLAETEPPLEKVVHSRNLMAILPHHLKDGLIPWLYEFRLTDQNGEEFYSRDLTGQVWIASFFFTRCGTVCPRQNAFLSKIQPELAARNAKLVSITTDPAYDTPEILRPYAKQLNASKDWSFLTGDANYVRRIGSEFLKIMADGGHHSSLLVVMDRWGSVRGRFDWQVDGESKKMLELIGQLNEEASPPASFEIISSKASGQ